MKKSFWRNEDGSAMVIALLILTLLGAFVALAVTRTSNETAAASNDAAESRAFAAAQGSLEIMTRNFDKIFEEKLSPAPADLAHVESQVPPGFEDDYDFAQRITQTEETRTVVMSGQLLQGLNALRDEWQVETTATDRTNGVEVALRRKFYNNRVPIFQFGIFYDDDLEFHPGPRFDFGGRVHSNANMFMMANTGLYFSSRVSAAGHILTDVSRNGRSYTNWGENVFIKNGSGTYVKLTHAMGSALKSPSNGDPVFTSSDMPKVYKNNDWEDSRKLFQGNLLSEQKSLNLPLKIASKIAGAPLDYIELVKRGKNVGDLQNDGVGVAPVKAGDADSVTTSKERYFNKKGIRISLSDSKAKLPGCAAGSGTQAVSAPCGIRLDGAPSGDGSEPPLGEARGYRPLTMLDGYAATRLNGERFFNSGRQMWIKIELVGIDSADNSIQTRDVTADILSLGVTERAPFNLAGYGSADTRSIVKLQRFAIPGVQLTASDTSFMSYPNIGGTNYNVVVANDRPTNASGVPTGSGNWTQRDNGGVIDNQAHYKTIPPTVGAPGVEQRVVPFPIEMFDTREGLYNDGINVGSVGSVYPGGNVPWAGVMSMVDIDVTNLRAFLDGQHNSVMPKTGTAFANANGRGLRNSDVPEANGWVLYVSDRRGDGDFDGEYDMEDIYGNNDGGQPQPGEDINNNKRLDADYINEAVRYTGTGTHVSPALAAAVDHPYYRRGVRLIRGERLPGIFDAADPLNTKGFTVASENGIYVFGNYNATGISSVGNPTPASGYNPQNTAAHVPASIVGDAVTILSNIWSDARSFRYPFDSAQRVASETHVRFALLSGDSRSSIEGTPNQGGGDPRMCGGVHNFKRFLERWNGIRLNYVGSIINLFNAHNNNGSYKNTTKVYEPPNRNWVFDSSFLDPTRLPPGTPFFQHIQLTGFQRVN
ncbi:MAG TPA: hypothetical protein VIL74_13385 [Pyrinomonadaceae bacterium]|jgi:hypothetical protein